jgi:N-acetyl sugar amidotransferase
MEPFRKPKPIDPAEYSPDNANSRTFFGLPETVQYCSRCVYSNQKPLAARENAHTRATKKDVLALDGDGVCDACRMLEKRRHIDWAAREAELIDLCNRHRRNDGHYDCVVPGSGGKDSFFAAHVLKYKYGMHPLTVTWAPHVHTDWGWRNFRAWIDAGFDNYLFTANGRVERLLTRIALESLLHPFQPFILGQYYFPPKLAAKLGIPLVFYGESPAEYGTPMQGNEKAQKDWDTFTAEDKSKAFLAGVSIQDLMTDFGLTAGDLDPFMPPSPRMLDDAGIQVHYLGYYLQWHLQGNYYYSVEHGGFEAAPERNPGTYCKYASIDDKIDDLHWYTTYIKFGIGHATYDAAQEVRHGDIDRDEAVALVRRYDGEYPARFENEMFRYLSIPAQEFPVASKMFEQPVVDRTHFDSLVDSFRSPHLWNLVNGQWRLRRPVWESN